MFLADMLLLFIGLALIAAAVTLLTLVAASAADTFRNRNHKE